MAKNKSPRLALQTPRAKQLADKTPGKSQLPLTKTSGKATRLSFSFEHFEQRQLFGFGRQPDSWFAALCDRLKDLSGKDRSIVEDKSAKQHYRLHTIDWNNCPIAIDDLTSIPKDVRDSAKKEDFIWQFQISKGNGRVIGYFNEDYSVFYIVLLDPNHNMQPSGYNDYTLRPTEAAITEYERMCIKFNELGKKQSKCQEASGCPIREDLENFHPEGISRIVYIDPELADIYQELYNNGTFQEKFEAFLFNELP